MSSSKNITRGEDPLLCPVQAAQLLSVNVKTLATWRSRGSGPAFTKLGGLVRYPASDLEAFIQRGRRSAA